jgi:hypothetical protein
VARTTLVRDPDPDDYSIIISRWRKAEQEAWEKRINETV